MKKVSRNLIWDVQTTAKEIFLTFDDGPIPGLTDYILRELEHFEAKATFFCVGDNIRKHPEIFQKVYKKGHAIGNHTFNHLKKWQADLNTYLENTEQCRKIIETYLPGKTPEQLFRPPYGQVSPAAIRNLKKNYKIIMWDILTYDFDEYHTASESLTITIKHTRPGSIVVWHDNYKAEKKLKYMLPRYLEHFSALGYKFTKLS